MCEPAFFCPSLILQPEGERAPMNYTSALLSMRRIISNHIDILTSRSGRNLEEYTQLIDEVLTPIACTTNPVVNRRLKIIAVQEAASIHNLNAHECTHTIETVLQPRLEEIDKLLNLATPNHLDSRRISSGNWATLSRIQSQTLDTSILQAGTNKVEENLAEEIQRIEREARHIMLTPENLVVPNSRRLTNLTKTLVAHLS